MTHKKDIVHIYDAAEFPLRWSSAWTLGRLSNITVEEMQLYHQAPLPGILFVNPPTRFLWRRQKYKMYSLKKEPTNN